MSTTKRETIDPVNWSEFRDNAHRMLDEMIQYVKDSSDRKAWQPLPDQVKSNLDSSLPENGLPFTEVYRSFKENIAPYSLGNTHPRFWGWVCGGGSPSGMLAEMMASGVNSTVSFGEHAAMYVEQQVLNWTKDIYDFPRESSGILTTGASMANVLAISIARHQFDQNIRKKGVSGQLTVYASAETHSCLQKAVELLGIGSDNLIRIPVDDQYKVRTDLLQDRIRNDRARGRLPFCIVGNAGTVNTGSIDDLETLAGIAREEGCWFHVDGAFGAVPNILPEYKHHLKGLSMADSLAFDYHKWFFVNYDAGGLLVKNAKVHRETFEINASYLAHHDRGVISGPNNYNHLGIELSRGFRALKVWMMLQEQGLEKYRRLVRRNMEDARYLASLVEANPSLQLMAPVPMNIVNFRYYDPALSTEQLNELNKEILMRLHETGEAVPSFTVLQGNYVIRVAHVNHRSQPEDFDFLARRTAELGRMILSKTHELTT